MQHNEQRLSPSKTYEKAVHSEKMSAYPLHSKDKIVTEGKTTVRSIAKVIQKKKRLDSPILIAGFSGPSRIDKH